LTRSPKRPSKSLETKKIPDQDGDTAPATPNKTPYRDLNPTPPRANLALLQSSLTICRRDITSPPSAHVSSDRPLSPRVGAGELGLKIANLDQPIEASVRARGSFNRLDMQTASSLRKASLTAERASFAYSWCTVTNYPTSSLLSASGECASAPRAIDQETSP
jgi:hypothetical protein